MPLAIVKFNNNKRFFCAGHIEEKNVTLWTLKQDEAVMFKDGEKVERYIRIYLSNRKDIMVLGFE